VKLIFRESIARVIAGVAIGAASSVAAAILLARYVPGVHSREPLTFAAMMMVLLAAAIVASFIPARRASRLDPVTALRQE